MTTPRRAVHATSVIAAVSLLALAMTATGAHPAGARAAATATPGSSAAMDSPGAADRGDLGRGARLVVVAATMAPNGSAITATVRWNTAMLALPGTGDDLDVRVLALDTHRVPVTVYASRGSLAHRAGQSTVTVRLDPTVAARLRGAAQVRVVATQSYDSPADRDRLFERNAVGSVRLVPSASRSTTARATWTVVPAGNCDGRVIGPRAQLAGCDLTGADLDGTDLTDSVLTNAVLDGANLTMAKADGVNLTDARLVRATLVQTSLRTPYIPARIVITKLVRADLTGADLTRANLSGALGIAGTTLESAVLTGTVLTGTNVEQVNSRYLVGQPARVCAGCAVAGGYLLGPGVRIQAFVVDDIHVPGVDLRNAALGWGAGNIQVDDSDFSGSNFSGATLGKRLPRGTSAYEVSNTNFSGANFTNADFTGTIGDEHRHPRCNFRGANFTGANLTGVGFGINADVRDAIFTAALMERTVFEGSDARGADFLGADQGGTLVKFEPSPYNPDTTFTDLSGARWFDGTICAPGSHNSCVGAPEPASEVSAESIPAPATTVSAMWWRW